MNWITTLVFALFHVGAIAALFMFSWTNLAVALFLLWACTGLGISMGYHRLHTHRSYQVPVGPRVFLRPLRRPYDPRRQARSSGLPLIASITRNPISRAIPIRPATGALVGACPAGFSTVRPTTTTRR